MQPLDKIRVPSPLAYTILKIPLLGASQFESLNPSTSTKNFGVTLFKLLD